MNVRQGMIWMFLGVFAVFGLYMIKDKVQSVKTEVAATETQLREARRNQHVLTAEWTYLNRPDRLRQLAGRYLDIKPVHGNQLADIDNLPEDGVIRASDPVAAAPKRAPLAKGMTLASGALHAQ